jgi:outer membrane protein assembly factor BamD (BamD/ComL family)
MFLFSLILIQACATLSTEWDTAQKTNSVKSYQAFLNKYPNSQQASDAKKEIENLGWQKVTELNHEDGYKWYLSEYPRGKYVAAAREGLQTIMWKNAQQEDSEAEYKKYLSKYPEGKYVTAARESLQTIMWKNAQQENSEAAYEKYLDEFPQGEFAVIAKERLEAIVWNKAQQNDSVDGYSNFIRRFPDSRYIDSVQEVLKGLLIPKKEIGTLTKEIKRLIAPFTVRELYEDCSSKSPSQIQEELGDEAASLMILGNAFQYTIGKLKPNSNPLTSTIVDIRGGSHVKVGNVPGKVTSFMTRLDKEPNMVVFLLGPMSTFEQDLGFRDVVIYPSDGRPLRQFQKIGDSWYKIK